MDVFIICFTVKELEAQQEHGASSTEPGNDTAGIHRGQALTTV